MTKKSFRCRFPTQTKFSERLSNWRTMIMNAAFDTATPEQLELMAEHPDVTLAVAEMVEVGAHGAYMVNLCMYNGTSKPSPRWLAYSPEEQSERVLSSLRFWQTVAQFAADGRALLALDGIEDNDMPKLFRGALVPEIEVRIPYDDELPSVDTVLKNNRKRMGL